MPCDICNIAVLYESDEWSDHKLAAELAHSFPGACVEMIDMTVPDAVERALSCDLLVNRVFASALFRGHEDAHRNMARLIDELEQDDAGLVNPAAAHFYEIDKVCALDALDHVGIAVPLLHARGKYGALDVAAVEYPAIVKPVCGGRTTHTSIVETPEELEAHLAASPDMEFMVQRYVRPERGFITRVEVVVGKPLFAVKRSVAHNGLSAYRFGSTYEMYDDCPAAILEDVTKAAAELDFFFGSFDIVESGDGAFFIDANSVSNVSEDCTELFGVDLMRCYAEALANRYGQEKEED
ncbi:MAG: hypothetical protein V8R08_02315 [Coriobacteriales bacterium]